MTTTHSPAYTLPTLVMMIPALALRLVCILMTLGLLLMCASELRAQVLAPLGVSDRGVTASHEVAGETDLVHSRRQLLTARVLLGIGGSFVGVVAGGAIGLAVPRDPCNCDDPGLSQALVGAAVGSIVLSGLWAATPQSGSTCSFERRIATGVGVSAIGAVVGGAIGALTGTGAVIWGYIIGAGVGAGVGSAKCGG